MKLARNGSISVIVPTLNEEGRIGQAIRRLRDSTVAEVIVVDGGSRDRTVEIAEAMGAVVLREKANRGRQQNAGARRASGKILLFLHADTSLPPGFEHQVRSTVEKRGVSAGAFRLRVDAVGWKFRLIEIFVSARCKLLQLPYGDQALFVAEDMFRQAGRFAELPVMEDFDLVRRLRRLGRVKVVDGWAVTSARRWIRQGILRATWRHQLCILGYLLNVPSARLMRLKGYAEKRDSVC